MAAAVERNGRCGVGVLACRQFGWGNDVILLASARVKLPAFARIVLAGAFRLQNVRLNSGAVSSHIPLTERYQMLTVRYRSCLRCLRLGGEYALGAGHSRFRCRAGDSSLIIAEDPTANAGPPCWSTRAEHLRPDGARQHHQPGPSPGYHPGLALRPGSLQRRGVVARGRHHVGLCEHIAQQE